MLLTDLFCFIPAEHHLPLIGFFVVFFLGNNCSVLYSWSVHLLGTKQCQAVLLSSSHHFKVVVLGSPIIKSVPFKHYISFVKNPRDCDGRDQDLLLARYPWQAQAQVVLLFQVSFPILLKSLAAQSQSFISHLKLFKSAHTALNGNISCVSHPVS